ncbi:MAG: LAGLIDADG family homing endonuclease [Nitrososphaerota archaeon]|nr:LAGLIDADG family homing endonuclease [Nitrososphaerota archaeon]
MREQGLGYKKIVREIERKYGERLSRSTVSFWVRGLTSPYNGRRFPSIEFLKPSRELAYVVGVVMGDGSVVMRSKKRGGYNAVYIELRVKDMEFAEEFSRCLGLVLGRPPPKPKYVERKRRYRVSVGDKTLFELLHGKSLEKIRPFVEHCDECRSAFLRGFFDSEGCISENGQLTAYNSNLELLRYVTRLLADLEIETTGPHLKTRRGTLMKCPKTGRIYKTNKDVYYIYVRSRSFPTYYRKVGFTIERKQKRLEEHLEKRGILPTPTPPFFHMYNRTLRIICIYKYGAGGI